MLSLRLIIQQHHENIMSTLVLIVCGVFGLVIVFVECELGQRMSNEFGGIGFTIDKLDWYLFPIDVQRMLCVIIANAQQTISLECFGSMTCTRELFKQVGIDRISTSFSLAVFFFTWLNQSLSHKISFIEYGALIWYIYNHFYPIQIIRCAFSYFLVLGRLGNWNTTKLLQKLYMKNK